MPDSLECAIIQYAPHMYLTKAAAMRAARAYSQKTLSGKSWGMLCTDAKINLGFQGHIKFSEAMIVIERHEHGWRWGAICKRGDVLVWVRLQNMRMAQIPYREAIGRWKNSETPIMG